MNIGELIVFIFVLLAIEYVFDTKWLCLVVMLIIISMIIYVIASSINIEKKSK